MTFILLHEPLWLFLQVFYLAQLAMHSSAPEGQSMHIDIRTSVANIHVSPPTIRTITACLMSLAPQVLTCNTSCLFL